MQGSDQVGGRLWSGHDDYSLSCFFSDLVLLFDQSLNILVESPEVIFKFLLVGVECEFRYQYKGLLLALLDSDEFVSLDSLLF